HRAPEGHPQRLHRPVRHVDAQGERLELQRGPRRRRLLRDRGRRLHLPRQLPPARPAHVARYHPLQRQRHRLHDLGRRRELRPAHLPAHPGLPERQHARGQLLERRPPGSPGHVQTGPRLLPAHLGRDGMEPEPGEIRHRDQHLRPLDRMDRRRRRHDLRLPTRVRTTDPRFTDHRLPLHGRPLGRSLGRAGQRLPVRLAADHLPVRHHHEPDLVSPGHHRHRHRRHRRRRHHPVLPDHQPQQRQGHRRHLRLHRRQRRDQTVDLERRRQPEVAVPGRRRRLRPHRQQAQRQGPRRRRRLHGRRGDHHPVHLRRRHQPARAVAGHREPLPPHRPAQRQMPRRRRLRHRRRGRHPAVHLRLRHQPAVVPYSVLGAHTMRRPALTTAARLLAVCTLAMALIAAPAHASNPLVHRFAADPSMHVYDNRVYVYTTDDENNSGTYWDSDAWRVYSSSDLVIWTDHGAPFSVGGFAWATRYAWAPSAAQRNGYYYLYLPTDRSRIGV